MTQCMLHDREVKMIFMSVIKHNFRNGLIQAARVPPGGRGGGGLHHKRERGQAARALVQVLY